MVEAPAGTGKTRLVSEALATLQPDCTVIWTRADPYDQDQPFGAVAQLVHSLPASLHSVELGGPQLVSEIVERVHRQVLNGPVVIVAEDFQWADPGSWRVMRALAVDAPSRALSVVFTVRTPFAGDGRTVLERLHTNGAERVELADLTSAEVQELTRSFLGTEPSSVQAELLHRSGGNPLFLTELLRSLQESDTLRTRPPGHAPLPGSLRSAVLSRLIGLGPRERQLLSIAALLGTTFSVDELAEIADRSVLDVIEGLRIALNAGVVLADRHELRFSHALVADCIREDQPIPLVRSLHRHIAQVLARRGASAQRVAEHYVLASIGDDPDGLSTHDIDAAVWLARASKETQPTSLPTAINLLERAVRASPIGTGRVSLSIQVAALYLLGGRLSEAETTCRDILVNRTGMLDPRQELDARSTLGAVGALRGPLHAMSAMAEFDAALDLAGPLGTAGHDPAVVADTLAAKALVLLYAGDADRAVELADLAIDAAIGSGNHGARSRAHEALALAALTRSDTMAAKFHAKESLAWFSPTNGPWAMIVTPHLTVSMVHVSLGDIDEAIAVCEAGLAVCSGSGHLMPRLYLLPCMAVFRLIQGNLTDASAFAVLTNDLIDDWCPSHPSPVTRAIVGYVMWMRGDPVGAVQQVDRAAKEMWDSGAQVAIADLVAWLIASVYEGVGRADEAFAFMHLVWSVIGSTTGAVVMATDLVRLALPRDRSVADGVVLELQRRVMIAPSRRNQTVLLRAQAHLRSDEAAMGEAATTFASMGNPLTEAWTLCDLAEIATCRVQAGLGDRQLAERAIRDAIKRFEVIGAPSATAELRAKARRIGVSLRPGRSSRVRGLSEVEELVAGLAVDGLTNREIGERLFISARTVETHLGRVFAKLGVKNRVQLTAVRSFRHSEP